MTKKKATSKKISKKSTEKVEPSSLLEDLDESIVVAVGEKDNIINRILTSESDGVLIAKKVTFSTGSVGYRVTGKVDICGHRCQVAGNIVVIGSKPTPTPTTKK